AAGGTNEEAGAFGEFAARRTFLGEDHEVAVHAAAVLEKDAGGGRDGTCGRMNDGGRAEGGADGTDSAGPEHGLCLARCGTIAHEDSQRPPANDSGDVLDRFTDVRGVVDGGVTQA